MTGLHWTFVGMGVFFALLGLGQLVKRVRTLVGGRVTAGVVVGKKEGSHSLGSDHKVHVSWHPVFEFEHEGRKYRSADAVGVAKPPAVGTRVRVRYLPSDPEGTAVVDAFLAIWMFPIGALVLGLVIALVAARAGGLIG
ncbi:MAG: DUF3592 domain-containing protein [Burkholderiales bacterium]